MGKERYRRGAHTVTDFKYHFEWKTKYSYGVPRGDTPCVYGTQSERSVPPKCGMNPGRRIRILSRIHPRIQMTFSLNERSR